MTQTELDKAVARATGESRSLISRYGFSLVPEEPERPARLSVVLDCPGCGTVLDVDRVSQPHQIECPRCDAASSGRRG